MAGKTGPRKNWRTWLQGRTIFCDPVSESSLHDALLRPAFRPGPESSLRPPENFLHRASDLRAAHPQFRLRCRDFTDLCHDRIKSPPFWRALWVDRRRPLDLVRRSNFSVDPQGLPARVVYQHLQVLIWWVGVPSRFVLRLVGDILGHDRTSMT